jgi:hypothetical protein
VGVRDAVTGRAAEEVRALRSRWRTATVAAGWAFPADWPLAEVDEVCAAVIGAGDPAEALAGLGRARAEVGAGLGETLQDLAALHAALAEPAGSTGIVSPNVDAVPSRMLRATALGWADVVVGQVSASEVDDPLTGLVTAGYLRTRLGEVYREARLAQRQPADDHALVLVALDLGRASGWSRVVAMTLLAGALRTVFDGGETLASIGPSVAAVLVRRDGELARRISTLHRAAADRLAADPHVRQTGPATVWLERLPESRQAALELVSALGR